MRVACVVGAVVWQRHTSQFDSALHSRWNSLCQCITLVGVMAFSGIRSMGATASMAHYACDYGMR